MDITEFLAIAHKLNETPRFKKLWRNRSYFRGEQYSHRQYDIVGNSKGLGMSGSMQSTPWEKRDPCAVWNLRKEVVQELTAWSVGGDSWCTLSVPDDAAAEQWLRKVSVMCSMADVISDARDIGGSQGAAIVSFAVRNGKVSLESHEPVACWVIEWADRAEYKPSIMAKVFYEDDMFVTKDDNRVLVCRIWTTTDETYYRRRKNIQGEWIWVVDQGQQVKHGLGFCPVYWLPQYAKDGGTTGEHDGENTSAAIDDVNYLFGAASITTRRNADDTLVIREDPTLKPTRVEKGANKAIFARGGADYLSQSGDSARVAVELAEKRARQVLRASRVVIPTTEELGRAMSGEAMRRLFAPMAKETSKLRCLYENGLIVPLCKGLLGAGRKLRGGIVVPPDVDRDDALGVIVQGPSVQPGKSNNVTVSWPDPFPPTWADKAAAIDAVSKATGGKAVATVKIALKILESVDLPVGDIEATLDELEIEADAAAEKAAKALGLSDPGQGESGPVIGESNSYDALWRSKLRSHFCQSSLRHALKLVFRKYWMQIVRRWNVYMRHV